MFVAKRHIPSFFERFSGLRPENLSKKILNHYFSTNILPRWGRKYLEIQAAMTFS